MTNGTPESLSFPACRKRVVEADFAGGEVTANGGVLLLRDVDRRLDLTASVARGLEDRRQRGKVRHRFVDMVRQRYYALALGHEDLNDHDQPRHDIAMQTATERDRPLASAPTQCRFENRATRDCAWSAQEALAESFLTAHERPPAEIVLDLDATDDEVHGRQIGRFFHGYYDHYCFLPLYVFAGDHLLVACPRPANIDGARHAGAVVKLLIARLRRAWPETRFVIRADSGFCRWRLLSWCDRNDVDYIIGLARNTRLTALAAPVMAAAERGFAASGEKQRRFAELVYGARSRDRWRRVIARLEHGPAKGKKGGATPRFVVTNLKDGGRWLYNEIYRQRGEMENRFKVREERGASGAA